MRMGGRGQDGLAKPVQTDNDGNIISKITVKDIATGNPVELSGVVDDDGNFVLRTVDAAPFAYDSESGRLKVEVVNPAKEIVTHDNVQIRDTEAYQTDRIDISQMSGIKMVGIRNMLDKPVTITIYGPYMESGTGGGSRNLLTVPASQTQFAVGLAGSSNHAERLLSAPFAKIIVRAKCDEAPTTGGVTVWISGVRA